MQRVGLRVAWYMLLCKKQRHYFADKGLSSQSYCFSSSHVWMWEWAIKKAECWWIDGFELWCWRRTLESPLDDKEIKAVNPKGSQSWIFIGGTVAEAAAPILWPPDAKSLLVGKDLDAGKEWRQEKRTTEGEMVGWHHRLNEHEFEQAPGDGEGQGSPVYFSPWGCKELDMIEWLNWTNWYMFNN